ncbi:unnamed protein product [Moneuplotes crassus]|uniref:Uncharacterized protein n=1 Tax=Euplotes crassus TaxID=5936 RepID=A0AAD1U2V8_EUPCR|nr:unnamed protein product [Moneuplotes crassus]
MFKETGVKQSIKEVPENSLIFLNNKASPVAIKKIDLLSLLKDNILSLNDQIVNHIESKDQGLLLKLPKLTNNFINKYLKGKLFVLKTDELSKICPSESGMAATTRKAVTSLCRGFSCELVGTNSIKVSIPAPVISTDNAEIQTLDPQAVEIKNLQSITSHKSSEISSLKSIISTKNSHIPSKKLTYL